MTPTEHLKYQWAAAAQRLGIAIDPSYRNAQGKAGADFQGVAVTYAQVAAHPALHRARTESRRTLVIFDEVHHAGDALSWGEAVREAFEPARRRLALTGTPFRSDANPIPFVTYVPEADGSKRSASDYVYGYGPALADGVVRPVIFLAYSGEMHWRTRAGDEITATLGTPMTKDQIAQAWRTALDPSGEWISRVLEAADKRLTEVRRAMPDAGGLVIAGDHETARAYAGAAAEDQRRAAGCSALRRPDRVQEDLRVRGLDRALDGRGPDGLRGRGRAAAGGRGLRDVACPPRCSSPRRSAGSSGSRQRGETASVFVPSVPVLLGFAAELEAERDHVVRALERDPEAELEDAQRERKTPDDFELFGRRFEALKASATFDRVLFDGGEFGTATEAGSPEEEDYLGLPGLLDPDQVSTLLRKRQAAQLATRSAAAARAAAAPAPADGGRRPRPGRRGHRDRRADGADRSAASSWPASARSSTAWSAPGATEPASRTASSTTSCASACGGPALPQASAEQIKARIDKIRQWALSRR